MRNELFIIEPGLWRAADPEEIAGTFDGLREMGLDKLPYRRVTVRIPADEIIKFINDIGANKHATEHIYCDIILSDPKPSEKPGWIDFECPKVTAVNGTTGFSVEITDKVQFKTIDEMSIKPFELTELNNGPDKFEQLVALHEQVRRFLIVMLATRNVRKITNIDKLAKLGIGARRNKVKHRYSHVTTISLPLSEEMEDDHEHKPTGTTKAPHLRRGHVRRQHYGPKNAYIKRTWIEPVFVNADPAFVSSRRAYNVGAAP